MSGKRRYTAGVEAALHVLSGGGCYRPGCGEPSIRFVEGEPQKNLETAHIHAFEDHGPRWEPKMPHPERNKLPNLILLCNPCHKTVDANERTYTAPLLKEWKSDREKQPMGSLSGLRDLDKDQLDDMLGSAMAEIRNEMAVFAEALPELAALLSRTLGEVPRLDPDSVNALYVAARTLGLPDHAPMLASAARDLGLPDHAPMLASAARELAAIHDLLPALQMTTDHLAEIPEHSNHLRMVAREIQTSVSNSRELMSDAANELESTISETRATLEPIAVTYLPSGYWKALLFGWAGWVVAALTVYLSTRSGT